MCDLCINIVTDLDQWLTSEHTEADIVRWVEQVKLFPVTNFTLLRAFNSWCTFCFGLQVCSSLVSLIPEEVCKSAIEAALPSIIDGIVNQYLTPTQVPFGEKASYCLNV